MERGRKIAVALLCLAALGVLVAGCGSGSGSGSGGSSSSPSSSSAPSAEFTKKGGNNGPATFGVVASEAEREQASKTLEENLKARAAGDWAKQCATLTAIRISQVETDAPNFGGGKGCAVTVREEAEPLSATKKIRANTMTEPIAVLRVKGKRGFALYHGARGKDYAMSMEKENGEWKVAKLATTTVP
jgi:hypothetical protein